MFYTVFMNTKLMTIFSQIKDKRRALGRLHNLNDILVMAVVAVLCGADTWNEIEMFCKAKEEWLTKFLDLKNGIPSHDTFNRVISSIDHKVFEEKFINWTSELLSITGKKEVISLDGKTVRGAKSNGKPSPIHIVSAWASANNLVLGQVKTDEKSNEITAVPELLDCLSIENTIVTADAMSCQKAIAKKIIDAKADYILALKGNQKQLLQDVEEEFRFGKKIITYEDVDFGHGRIETRKCSLISDFLFLQDDTQWTSLKTIIRIESKREFKNSDRPAETMTRYYITSLINMSPEDILAFVRSHWEIENKLHWCLDIAFREDESRKRKDNAAENFAILRKIVLNLLRTDKSKKVGLKSKRLIAGWDNKYLEQLLKK